MWSIGQFSLFCFLSLPDIYRVGDGLNSITFILFKITSYYSSQPIQINRLKSRNHLNSTESISIIQSQSTLSQKLNHADYVLENSGTLIDLESQVQRLVWKLEKIHSRLIWFLSWWILPFGLLNGLLTILWRLYVQRIGSHHRKQPNLNSNTGSTSSTSISRP